MLNDSAFVGVSTSIYFNRIHFSYILIINPCCTFGTVDRPLVLYIQYTVLILYHYNIHTYIYLWAEHVCSFYNFHWGDSCTTQLKHSHWGENVVIALIKLWHTFKHIKPFYTCPLYFPLVVHHCRFTYFASRFFSSLSSFLLNHSQKKITPLSRYLNFMLLLFHT